MAELTGELFYKHFGFPRPTDEEYEKIKDEAAKIRKTHIAIKKPQPDENDFLQRYGYHLDTIKYWPDCATNMASIWSAQETFANQMWKSKKAPWMYDDAKETCKSLESPDPWNRTWEDELKYQGERAYCITFDKHNAEKQAKEDAKAAKSSTTKAKTSKTIPKEKASEKTNDVVEDKITPVKKGVKRGTTKAATVDTNDEVENNQEEINTTKKTKGKGGKATKTTVDDNKEVQLTAEGVAPRRSTRLRK